MVKSWIRGRLAPVADMGRGWQSKSVLRRKAWGKSVAMSKATSVSNVPENLGGRKFAGLRYIRHLRVSIRTYTAELFRPNTP